MEVLGHICYEKLEEIGVGQGKMSTVYRAKDKFMGGECAIKEIPKNNLRKQQITDFFQEAKAMFAPGCNPSNVVPIRYACDVPNADTIAICMPFYGRKSLLDRTRSGPLRTSEILRVAHGTLNGLQKIHTAGYIHFDLKPSNVLFSDIDEPLVADFGQTRPVEKDGTTALPAMYRGGLPPEFFTGSTGTIKTDIFHMGVLLYRMANGEPFFDSIRPTDDAAIRSQTLAGKFPDTSKFLPHVPKALRTVIRRCVDLDPVRRFASAAELDNTLCRIAYTHDWQPTENGNGEITWTSLRRNQCDIEVALKQSGRNWRVLINGVNNGKRRARATSEWCEKPTRGQAMKHLKTIFEKLA